MKPRIFRYRIQYLVWLWTIVCLPALAIAQYISVKTIPVASGDQFMMFPSQTIAMGGVSIALEDPLLDAFVNPAKGMRLQGMRLFGSPTFYTISEDNGSAKTLPLGFWLGTETHFAGASVALQQLGAPEQGDFFPVPLDFIANGSVMGEQSLLSKKNAHNAYVSGFVGATFPQSKSALAVGVAYAGLNAVDGVELLYANSQAVEQSGYMADYRVGYVRELPGDRTFEAMLLYNRFDMTHDVTYARWFWDEAEQSTMWQSEVVRNRDVTKTWGLHLGYELPVGQRDWRVGGIFTVNRKSHPKIPNYELMNIPRDPGTTWAYNFGIGTSRRDGNATFAADLIFEPIRSHTWAEAAAPVETVGGWFITPGRKTVDNHFVFHNWLLRLGLGHQADTFGFQVGLQVRWINYRLDQHNIVEEFQRVQRENWAEWTPSIGLNLNFPEFQLRYVGRLTTGTGRPGVAWNGLTTDEAFAGADFIPAAGGPLTLQEATVWTHQISVAIPIRD